MGAGGTFLRVLAVGTLAVVMAAVTPPEHNGHPPRTTDPDYSELCEMPEETGVDGCATVLHYDIPLQHKPLTLYLHASEMFDALLFHITDYNEWRAMWVPFSRDCMDETEGWYEVLVDCGRWKFTDLATCSYQVKNCKRHCIMDMRLVSIDQFFVTITVYGRSLWVLSWLPETCLVHEVIHNVYDGPIECPANPFANNSSTKGCPPPTTGTL